MTTLLGALQFGISGLSAILFIVLVGILQTEQKRDRIRPSVLRAIRGLMVFGVFLVLVSAALGALDYLGMKRIVREQLAGLSRIENLKIYSVLGSLPNPDAQKILADDLLQVCDAIHDLKDAVGDNSRPSDACLNIKQFHDAHP
jgi:hypothetical protein